MRTTAVAPPSTRKSQPVIKLAASLAKNHAAEAISLATPALPAGAMSMSCAAPAV
jgi:hypothetical protein